MHMGIDETGHQGFASEINALGVLQGDWDVGDLADAIRFNHHMIAVAAFVDGSIEQCGVFEDDRRHGVALSIILRALVTGTML